MAKALHRSYKKAHAAGYTVQLHIKQGHAYLSFYDLLEADLSPTYHPGKVEWKLVQKCTDW